MRPCQGDGGGGGAGEGGGGVPYMHVACLNFKTSRVGVYKCLKSLSEIERKFFVLKHRVRGDVLSIKVSYVTDNLVLRSRRNCVGLRK